jgi:hypothetical protein
LRFSRAKSLRFEDHIYLLSPPLLGVRSGKKPSVFGGPKLPQKIGHLPH